jgi:hypothetical protein
MYVEIEDVDCARMAADVRAMADEIERGVYVAFAIVGCDKNGNAARACLVDPNKASYDLLDEMAYSVKKMLFESYEAGE